MRILLVDDHVMFREGLASILKSQPDMQVVGEAGTIHESIQLVRQLKPDTVLMDIGLPDGSGIDATREILAEDPAINIIYLTIYDTDDRLFAAVRSGAKGYLLKNLPAAKLLSSLRAIEKNEAAISRTMTLRIMEEFSRQGPPSEPQQSKLSTLTLREMEILRELANDATNQEIALRLSVTETTVKNHVHRILAKLGVKNRKDAARFARQQGLGKYTPP